MANVFGQLLILYIFILLGWFFGRIKSEQRENSNILSFLLVNLFLPCKVFRTFAKNCTPEYFSKNYLIIIISLLMLVFLVLFGKLFSRLLTKKKYERKVYEYSLTISNYAYLGYILVESLLGEVGLTNMILFCIPFAIYTYTAGFALLTGKGKLIKKLFNPIVFAIIFGIIFGVFEISIPKTLLTVLEYSSNCIGPLSMLLTGIVLSEFTLKELTGDIRVYVFMVIRLVLLPFCIFLISTSIKAPQAVLVSATIMACMPCGLNTVVFPKLVGEDCKTGARLAFISHLFSCATIPFWISLLM